ncbi:MAG: hypothetical protein COB84_07265, partial [Rhodobacteraceae bacterium]
RLSLSKKEFHEDLLTLIEPEQPVPSRTDFLMSYLMEGGFEYEPRSNINLLFKPIVADETAIAAIVARKRTISGHFDESNPFTMENISEWELANVYFNLGDDEQVVGVELNRAVAQNPKTLIQDIASHINSISPRNSYEIHVFELPNKESFWQAVESFGSEITSLTFDMVMPNPVKDSLSATEKAMDRLKTVKGQRLQETYTNNDGLNLDNDMVRDHVKRTEGGSGGVSAKSHGTHVYSTDKSGRTVELDDEFGASEGEKTGLLDRLRNILLR